jgi:hypothetical protein
MVGQVERHVEHHLLEGLTAHAVRAPQAAEGVAQLVAEQIAVLRAAERALAVGEVGGPFLGVAFAVDRGQPLCGDDEQPTGERRRGRPAVAFSALRPDQADPTHTWGPLAALVVIEKRSLHFGHGFRDDVCRFIGRLPLPLRSAIPRIERSAAALGRSIRAELPNRLFGLRPTFDSGS